jgi:hypothetical protein
VKLQVVLDLLDNEPPTGEAWGYQGSS